MKASYLGLGNILKFSSISFLSASHQLGLAMHSPTLWVRVSW